MYPQLRETADRAGRVFREQKNLQAALDVLADHATVPRIWCLREFTGLDLRSAVQIVEGVHTGKRFDHIGPTQLELILAVPHFGGEHGHWIRHDYIDAVLGDAPTYERRRFFAVDDEDDSFEGYRSELRHLADTDPFLRGRVEVTDTDDGLSCRFTLS